MDTATASLENKPLKETEAPLDDASPEPGCDQLPAAIKRKNKTKKRHYYQQISSLVKITLNDKCRLQS